MNEAERGIAAYKAVSKAGQTGRRRKKKPSQQSEEVSLGLTGQSGVRRTKQSSDQRSQEGAPISGASPAKGLPTARSLLEQPGGDRGYRKVAKFLLLLGKEEAGEILKHFEQREVEAVSREIASIKSIDKEEARRLLSEFGVRGASSPAYKAGPATARAMLSAAFGEARAEKILARAAPDTRERPFRFLNEIDDHQLHLLLKDESAPTTSVVLSYLVPQKAAKLLQSLTPERQRETIRRIAKMRNVEQEVIVRIEGVLKERIRSQGKVTTEEIDGRDALANILKYLDYSQEEKILDEIATYDPALSQNVKERLFTIDLIFQIDDAELQAILRDYEDEEIATILKAKPARIQNRLLENLSTRRQTIVNEEMLRLGKMRKSDVERATKDFVDYLVDLDDQNKLTIHWGDQIVE